MHERHEVAHCGNRQASDCTNKGRQQQ
jgi:hypothetical protein